MNKILRVAKLLVVPALLGATLLAVQGVLAAPPDLPASFTYAVPAGGCGTFTFTSTATDPDGDIEQYEWDFNGDLSPDATGPQAAAAFDTVGLRTVTLTVTDGSAGLGDLGPEQAVGAQAINVTNQGAPTAAVSGAPNPAGLGQPVTYSGAGSSDVGGGPIVRYEWDLDNNGSFEVDTGATATSPVQTYNTTGPKTVRLRVTDACGATDTDTASVFVSNTAPQASFTITPAVAQPGQPVTFNGSASTDSDGSIASYEWDLDGDGTYEATGATVNKTYASATTVTVRLRVTDNSGSQDIDTQTLRVNSPPVANFSFVPEAPVINEQVTFTSGAFDFDGSVTKYEWDLDGNGSYETDTLASNVAARMYANAGTYNVGLRVTDNNLATTEFHRAVVVQQTRPNASFVYAPLDPVPGQTVTLTSTSTPSGSPGAPKIESTQWDFDHPAGSDFNVDASGPTATLSFGSPGTKTVAVRVTETGGGTAVATQTIVVNARPTAAFTVAPTSPTAGTDITFASTSGDPDGPLAKQEWDLDGNGTYEKQGAAVSAKLGKGSYAVKLLVTDSKGATATTTRVVTVRAKPLGAPPNVERSLAYTRTRWGIRLVGLAVRVPAKTTVTVRCKGRGCPHGTFRKRAKKRAPLVFKKVRGSLRAGAKIYVISTLSGHIGEYTTYKVRGHNHRPTRRVQCIWPGADRPRACPAD
jgi:PKD repeat protein